MIALAFVPEFQRVFDSFIIAIIASFELFGLIARVCHFLFGCHSSFGVPDFASVTVDT